MTWTNLGLDRWRYQKGLHELGAGVWAWLQPDGSWGYSNAGLLASGEHSLLVDTLFDLRLTREMLDAMRAVEPRATNRIDTVVNTHANGDHCHGNQLLAGAEIIASAAAAREMVELPPERLAEMQRTLAQADSKLGRYLRRIFGDFEFEGIRLEAPTRCFSGELTLQVGDKRVQLIEVGPAHTRGDLLVFAPDERVAWSGDILFVEGTPIIWSGPVSNWIRACDRLEALAVDVIVPGHGPITDRRGVQAVRSYLEYIYAEAALRFEAGLDAATAARDIELGPFADWSDAERIAVNVATIYRELDSAAAPPPDTVSLLSAMAELAEAD